MTMESVQALLERLIKFAYANGPNSGMSITRYSMYRLLTDKLKDLDDPEKLALSISHSEKLVRTLGLNSVRIASLNFPEYNILDLKMDDACADFIVSDQVMEHIGGSPYKAFSESVRVLKPGGILCHTTVFIMPVHGDPIDFWRFSPDGLAELCRANGAEVIEASGWGNREAWSLMHMGFWGSGIPLDKENPINKIATFNDPRYPIVVWVLGRKPDAA